jgi:BspA type Leucine rich repeat region (6 copies)
MPITETKEGFKIFEDKNSGRILILKSDAIRTEMDFYRKHHLDGISINKSHGFNSDNLDFLKDYPDIRHISISEGIKNFEGLYTLTGLNFLILSGKKLNINFSKFASLKELSIDWGSKIQGLDSCKNLQRLSVFKYNSRTKDFSEISELVWLKELEITQSNIVTLNGLKRFEKLEKLHFAFCPKLKYLCDLEGSRNSISSIIFKNCKSILNYDYVQQLKKLKILAFNNCGEIPSIQFIKKMSELEEFRFVNTNIKDGDLSPCLKLKYTGFFNKSHYSHTYEQLNPGIKY